MEALAARRVAKFAIELGISSSEFEGDSEVVCEALKAAEWGHPSLGQIIKDTWSIVSSLRIVSFSYTRPQGNGVAHVLAKRTKVSFSLISLDCYF